MDEKPKPTGQPKRAKTGSLPVKKRTDIDRVPSLDEPKPEEEQQKAAELKSPSVKSPSIVGIIPEKEWINDGHEKLTNVRSQSSDLASLSNLSLSFDFDSIEPVSTTPNDVSSDYLDRNRRHRKSFRTTDTSYYSLSGNLLLQFLNLYIFLSLIHN